MDSLSLERFFLILKKHWKLIAVITLLCGLSGYGLSRWVIKPQYVADASLIVNADGNMQNTNVTYDQITAAQELVNTYAVVLKSYTVLNQVVAKLGLDVSPSELAQSITVTGVNKSQVIDISVTGSDPQSAVDIANEITEVAPAAIVDTVKAGSIKTISPAKKPDKPVSPNIPFNTSIALFAGFLISVVLTIVCELRDHTFKSYEDLQKNLKVPVLCVVPDVKRKEFRIG